MQPRGRAVRAQEKRRLWDESGGFPVQWKNARHGGRATFRARRVQFGITLPNLHMRFLRRCGSLCGYFQSNPAARTATPGNQNLPAYRQDSQNLPGHKQPDSCLCADALSEMFAVPGSQKKACLQFAKMLCAGKLLFVVFSGEDGKGMAGLDIRISIRLAIRCSCALKKRLFLKFLRLLRRSVHMPDFPASARDARRA